MNWHRLFCNPRFMLEKDHLDINFPVSRYKQFELEIMWLNEIDYYFNVVTRWDKRGDHCGAKLEIEILKFSFCVSILDGRHWDYEKNTYESDKEAV